MRRLLPLLLLTTACGGSDEDLTSVPTGADIAPLSGVDVDAIFATATPTFELVDPFIGTGGQGAQVTGVNPGASAPNGLTLVAPDTRHTALGAPAWLHLGGYHYDDDRISGFAHTRGHGIGIHDYGAIQVMPRAEAALASPDPAARAAPFDHLAEAARPGSYEVTLQDDGTDVVVVATTHGAHHRYAFAAGSEPVVVLDLAHVTGTIGIGDDTWAAADVGAGTVEGMQRILGGYSDRYDGILNHFAMRFDPAPVAVSGWTDPSLVEAGLAAVGGSTAGLMLHFAPGTEAVDVRVGLSFVDVDGAWNNLHTELPDLDQQARRDTVEGAWRERLDRVEVVGGSESDRVVFATALYHTLLMPSRQDDVDGRYRGLDQAIHTSDHPVYSDLSLWDTFRTLHPWYLLAWPDLQLDCLRSLERMVEDGGALPRWPMAHGPTGGMVGTPAAQVLAGSWLKGLQHGWDTELLWGAAIAASTESGMPYAGRRGIEEYRSMGYVPKEVTGGSASRTLEFAWSDASLAAWGEAMGAAADQVAMVSEQSGHWANIWDPETSFFRARRLDGGFDPLEHEHGWLEDYVEGNAWHYVWYVPYDVQGMIGVQHGGDVDAFLARLGTYWDNVEDEDDDLLPDDWYWHGNEPVLHYASLASLAGDRALSTRAADWIATHRYDDTPEGLDGNDDAGTLSAWYLWTSLGLYPIAGFDRYAVLSPRFEGVRVRRDDGDVVVLGPATPGEAVPLYALEVVDGEAWPGAALDGDELTHADLVGGLYFAQD